MHRLLDRLFLLRCRLCWRVTATIFLSVLLMEVVVVGFSFRNDRANWIEAGRGEAADLISGLFDGLPPGLSPTAVIAKADPFIGVDHIRRIVFLGREGTPLGEVPAGGRFAKVNSRARFHAHIAVDYGPFRGAVISLAFPNDGIPFNRHLWRLVGWLALGSLVVTLATILVLRLLVLGPILALDHAFQSVEQDPSGSAEKLLPVPRADELGSVMKSFAKMLGQIRANLAVLGESEASARQLALSLERRVAERTAALREALEAAEQSNRAKSEFLANMSHELRTPLNAVIGFAQFLASEPYGPLGSNRYREYVDDIERSGNHLLRLINDLLDLTRVEAGALDLHEEAVEVSALLDECIVMLGPFAATSGVALECAPLAPLPPIWADRLRLRQIMLNLLSNAIKFSASGDKVVVSAKWDPATGFAITVSDTGIGIAAKDMRKVLSPFGQVHSALNRRHQGTGLGLPLCVHLAQLHGGRLELKSAIGAGTEAILYLPSERCLSDAVPKAAVQARWSAKTGDVAMLAPGEIGSAGDPVLKPAFIHTGNQ